MILALVATLAISATGDAQQRIVVAPLKSDAGTEALAASVHDRVVQGLSARTDVEVVTEAEVARLLRQEEQNQLAGCSSDKCLADLARIAEASELITGSVTTIIDHYTVSLVRLDSASGAVRRRVQRETRSDEEMLEAIAEAVDALWDTSLPASRCVECVALNRRGMVTLKLGNNFATFFSQGLDVNVLAPGFDLELAYHFWSRVSLTFSAGLSFGKSSTSADDKVHFQVVPLTLGVRYDTWRPSEAVLIYTGAAIGVGFVRTALSGNNDLTGAFSADVDAGLIYAFARRFRFITDVGYQITTNTPGTVRSHPFNALVIQIGAAFVF